MIEFFNTIFLEPVLNCLVALSHVFGGSFGLSIIAVTVIINLIMLPLTIKQTRSMIAMQEKQRAMAPKMQELQKKYTKDKQKLQAETFKLWKEHGFSPAGCVSPMLLLIVQMPIWLAIYQGIMNALATTPERMVTLSGKLYSWSPVQEAVPPDRVFLGIDLAEPNFLLVVLVGITMWFTQKLSATPAIDPKQQQMQQMMQMMFPLFLCVIFIDFPSGLPMYILIANLIRMIVQFSITGRWTEIGAKLLRRPALATPGGQTVEVPAPPEDKTAKEIKSAAKKSKVTTEKENEKGKGTGDGSSRSKRKNRRRGR
ncbi:MAG: membrane protein insertase YidC [Chloroflexi bacterium]|nr:membrane protein insertase YidC [Chloroflexota bacterium]